MTGRPRNGSGDSLIDLMQHTDGDACDRDAPEVSEQASVYAKWARSAARPGRRRAPLWPDPQAHAPQSIRVLDRLDRPHETGLTSVVVGWSSLSLNDLPVVRFAKDNDLELPLIVRPDYYTSKAFLSVLGNRPDQRATVHSHRARLADRKWLRSPTPAHLSTVRLALRPRPIVG